MRATATIRIFPGDILTLDGDKVVCVPATPKPWDKIILGTDFGIAARGIDLGEVIDWDWENNTADIYTNNDITFEVQA